MATGVQQIQAALPPNNPVSRTLQGIVGLGTLQPNIIQHLEFRDVSNLRLAQPGVNIDINNPWYKRECEERLPTDRPQQLPNRHLNLWPCPAKGTHARGQGQLRFCTGQRENLDPFGHGMGKNICRHCHRRGVERWFSFSLKTHEDRLDLCDECIVDVGVPPGNRLDNCTCQMIAGPNHQYCFQCRDAAHQRYKQTAETFKTLVNETCPRSRNGSRTIAFDRRKSNAIAANPNRHKWPTRCPCGNIVKTKGSGWGACPRCFELKVGIMQLEGPQALVFPQGLEALVRDNRARSRRNRVRNRQTHHHKFRPMQRFFRLPIPAAWPGATPQPVQFQGLQPGGGPGMAILPGPQPPQHQPRTKVELIWGDWLNWGT